MSKSFVTAEIPKAALELLRNAGVTPVADQFCGNPVWRFSLSPGVAVVHNRPRGFDYLVLTGAAERYGLNASVEATTDPEVSYVYFQPERRAAEKRKLRVDRGWCSRLINSIRAFFGKLPKRPDLTLIGSFSGRESPFVQMVAETLPEAVDKEVLLYRSAARYRSRRDNADRFHLILTSADTDSKRIEPAARVLRSRESAFWPYGIQPYEPESACLTPFDPQTDILTPQGELVARVVENRLYIYGLSSDQEAFYGAESAILRMVLKEFLHWRELSFEQRQERFNRCLEQRREIARIRFAAATSGLRNNYLAAAVGARRETLRGLRRERQRLVLGFRQLQTEQRKQVALQSVLGEVEGMLRDELQKAKALPQVRTVELLTPQMLCVLTHALTQKGQPQDIPLGEFQIILFLDGGNGCVRFFNLSRQVDGSEVSQHAPRVDSKGCARGSKLITMLPGFLGSGQISSAVQTCLRFLTAPSVEEGAELDRDGWVAATRETTVQEVVQ